MKEEHEAHALALMLDRYCEWLNLWMNHDAVNPHRYHPTQFLDYRPEEYLYGASRSLGVLDNPPYHLIYAFKVYDVDDGGPTTLLGWFWRRNPQGLDNMIQEFDGINVILEGGVFVDTPEDHDL